MRVDTIAVAEIGVQHPHNSGCIFGCVNFRPRLVDAPNRQLLVPVSKNKTMPFATVMMLMHSTPKMNCTPQAVGDPLTRPLMIARQVMIDQNTQAAPKA
jgi:hypothetical protein